MTIDTSQAVLTQPAPQRAGVELSVSANSQRCFPGEDVVISAQLMATHDLLDAVVVLKAPAELVVQSAQSEADVELQRIEMSENGKQNAIWRVPRLTANVPIKLEISTKLMHAGWGWQDAENFRLLHVECSLFLPSTSDSPVVDRVSIAVFRQGDLVKYLPGIYQGGASTSVQSQEFMWRFLMLFERLWDPLEDRINHIDSYFDRAVAPQFMLPWLAWALSFMLEEEWDERKSRHALGEMVRLYRMRGTKEGLKSLLALYLEERPAIIEHGVSCLRLGDGVRLGYNTALGDRSRPYEFIVAFRRSLSSREQALAGALIAANKPMHTTFDLISRNQTLGGQ